MRRKREKNDIEKEKNRNDKSRKKQDVKWCRKWKKVG